MATESFFSSASLAYLASAGAGKDGKAYSIKPTDGTGDFTFSRGSNLTATRVGPTGLIEKGRENLLLQSNQFDTTWTNNNSTETGGQSGYDGSSDAWLLEKSAVSLAYINQNVSASGAYTISVYAKAGTLDTMNFFISAAKRVQFNLGNGTIDSSSSGVVDSKIEAVSGATGWYRCSATFADATTYVRIYPQWTETTAGSIYIQDAQIEIGLAATDYIESGATTGKAGLLEDEPRFDYSGGATCPSLLLEPSRTNQFKYSEYFEFGLSSQSNVTSITTNTTETLSPEGLYNATKGVFASAWNFSDVVTPTTNVQSTTSVYVKAVNPSSNNTFRIFTGGITSGNLTATSEWKRFDFTATSTGGSLCGIFRDSSSNPAELYFYGMQTEVASYPTSYIPNHSGGTITRGAEGRNYSGLSSLIGQTEGTLFLDIDSANLDTEIFSLNRSTQNAIFLITSNTYYRVFIYCDGTNLSYTTSINITDRIRVAIAYQSNNLAVYVNGSQAYTNNTQTWTPNVAMDLLNFNNGGYASSKGVARYNQVLLFKERLSNADLATLTTI